MKWIDKLKEYAPDIAAAIISGGATLPSLANKAIADAMGQDVNSNDDIADLIANASPETMLKVKQANNAFKIRMRELDSELGLAELKNQEQARESHKHSVMPALVTLMMTVIIGFILNALLYDAIPKENEQLLYLLLGQALALWTASVTYWVGTTRSSAEKTMMMGSKK